MAAKYPKGKPYAVAYRAKGSLKLSYRYFRNASDATAHAARLVKRGKYAKVQRQ